MIFSIPNLLTPEELETIINKLEPADFIDGKKTAGWHARLVKDNRQLSRNASYAKDLKTLVGQALVRHPQFQSGVRPRAIHSILFSCYEAGMQYGSHVDNALMGSEFLRSDVSFTLFLNSPSDYEGGELVIEEMDGERPIKLEEGSVIVYPSSTLHRVETVLSGFRLVAVGWVQSLVRDVGEREILFDLDQARRSLFETYGKTKEFDLISKSHANLLRKWADS